MVRAAEGRDPKFSFAAVLGNGLTLFFGRAPFFAGISLILHLPMFAADVFGFTSQQPGRHPHALAGSIAIQFVLSFLIEALLDATLIYAVVMELSGKPASLDQVWFQGLRRAFPAVLTSIVATLMTIGGALLLVVPAFIVQAMVWAAVPVTVVERLGPFGSVRRSRFLTKYHRWPIFGLIVVYGIANAILAQLANAITLLAGASPLGIMAAAGTALEAVAAAAWAVTAGYGYYLLVNEKDGADTGQIAAVFD